jgi:hypothetical protein
MEANSPREEFVVQARAGGMLGALHVASYTSGQSTSGGRGGRGGRESSCGETWIKARTGEKLDFFHSKIQTRSQFSVHHKVASRWPPAPSITLCVEFCFVHYKTQTRGERSESAQRRPERIKIMPLQIIRGPLPVQRTESTRPAPTCSPRTWPWRESWRRPWPGQSLPCPRACHNTLTSPWQRPDPAWRRAQPSRV